MEKILCPRHEEVTPSCVIYDTHAYCYGCAATIPLSELGREATAQPKPRFKEDLEKKRSYIDTLPTKEIRGLPFRYDDTGFYITWSDCLYYKLRVYNPGDGPKYRNPTGHAQPMFWARRSLTGTTTLYMVEGEINAISLSSSIPGVDVCSPGSAPNFLSPAQSDCLTSIYKYASIVIVVDRDGPGVQAAIKTKAAFLGKVPYVSIVLMDQDCNKVLVEHGSAALRDELQARSL